MTLELQFTHIAKSNFRKNTSKAYTLTATPNNTPTPRAACKVLLNGMNILENYAACCLTVTPVLFDTNAAGCIPNPPNVFFMK
jgi:hypothetical protein